MHYKKFVHYRLLLLMLFIALSNNETVHGMEHIQKPALQFAQETLESFFNSKVGEATIFITGGCLTAFLTVFIGTKTFNWLSQKKQIQPKIPTVNLDNVAGIENNDVHFQEIFELVDMLQNPQVYTNLGAELSRGILLEGPPGNGKSLLAQAIAGSVDCHYFEFAMSDFNTKWVGEGADKIREIFATARKLALQKKVIIFFDELDSIGNRNKERTGVVDQTIAQLLVELAALNENITIFAVTNLRSNVDPAIIRSGRFSSIIKVSEPNEAMRHKILVHFSNKLTMEADIRNNFLQKIAQKTTDFSGADLKELMNHSALIAGRARAGSIQKAHIKKACKRVTLKIKDDKKEKSDTTFNNSSFPYLPQHSRLFEGAQHNYIPPKKRYDTNASTHYFYQKEQEERDMWAENLAKMSSMEK